MNIDALYDYLKLLVPNDYHVEMGSNFITVNKCCNGVYDLDVYYLKGEYIVLSAMNYDLKEYIKRIFGKPLSKETFTTYNEYYFSIPEGLQ